LFRKMWELSFRVPLTLSNYRQLKNVSGVIPTHHDLDNTLLIECIRDFRRQGVFRKDQGQVVRVLQMMTEAGWVYLPRSQRSEQKFASEIEIPKSCAHRVLQRHVFRPYKIHFVQELHSIGADRRDQLFEWL